MTNKTEQPNNLLAGTWRCFSRGYADHPVTLTLKTGSKTKFHYVGHSASPDEGEITATSRTDDRGGLEVDLCFKFPGGREIRYSGNINRREPSKIHWRKKKSGRSVSPWYRVIEEEESLSGDSIDDTTVATMTETLASLDVGDDNTSVTTIETTAASTSTREDKQHQYIEISMKCKTCCVEFAFTAGDQEFYASKGYVPPKKCKRCRNN